MQNHTTLTMQILGLIPKDAQIHPLAERHKNRLLVFIPKSTSKNMPLAINMMEQADEFEIIKIGNKAVYVGAFALTLNQITLVSAITEMASQWKGFSIFFNHQNLKYNGWFWRTLECYKQALQCNDHKAHCHTIEKPTIRSQLSLVINIHPNPQPREPIYYTNYLVPCRQLRGIVYRLDSELSASIPNRLQAMAVEHNCHWCPFLNVDDYREIEMVDRGD